MARTRTEVESELKALREDVRADIVSECWAYDDTSERYLRQKQAHLKALELELDSLEA